jgi:hypothetical protein
MGQVRETSRDYRHPHRPPPVRWVNAAGEKLWALGLLPRPRFDPDELIRRAVRAEGRSDLGAEDYREPLDRLCRALETEARLTPTGALIARKRVVDALRNRLRVEAAARAHPAVVARPMAPPVLIVGLQRTGTTFLQRLLGADPRLRPLRSWEALAAVPGRRGPPGGEDPRRAAARQAERGLRYLAPDFFAVHPVDADGPEEEVLLMDPSFRTPVPEATFRVPSFRRWLEDDGTDLGPGYDYLRKSLALLSADGGEAAVPDPRPWLLKSPAHLEYLDLVLATFPGVRILHTHRDPLETVASFCSMVAHGRGIFSDQVDPEEVGAEWLGKTARLVRRALDTRDRVGDAAFLDVGYRELVADPMGTLDRIYRFLDLDLPGDVRAQLEARRRASPQHRFGKHVYALSDFGLRRDDVREAFQAYRARFGMTA